MGDRIAIKTTAHTASPPASRPCDASQCVRDDRAVKGIVLAAGAGTRLRPLTELLPKALCPVGNRPLLDFALDRLRTVTDEVAVNVHAHRAQMETFLAGCTP